jgi:hypothetical protein
MRKQILLFGLLTAIVVPFFAAVGADGNGGYAGSFFQVAIGARPTAMGGAYLAISNDGAGPLYNPAGLADLKFPLFGSSYRAMQLGRKLGYITALFPVRNKATLGVHWLYAGSGSVQVRNSNGQLDDDYYYNLGGSDFSLNSHVFGLVFAKRFSDAIAAGAKLNYLVASFPQTHANGISFDFGGTLYVDELLGRENKDKLPIRDVRVALVVRHIGGEYKWTDDKWMAAYTTGGLSSEQTDKIPVDVGLGLSGRLLKDKLLLATDLVKNQYQAFVFHGGAEYFVTPELALRGGYGDKQFGIGTGYVIKLGTQALAIDYAFASEKSGAGAGSEHIFSFDLLFK